MSKLEHIPLDQIRPLSVILREDKGSERFSYLVDSIRKNGVINPVILREVEDPKSGHKYYGLIDGLRRYSAAKDIGLIKIPAYILSLEEGLRIFTHFNFDLGNDCYDDDYDINDVS